MQFIQVKLGVIIFGSVRFLSKKVTKLNFFFCKKKSKSNRNRVKPTGFGSVFLGQKPVQTGLARFFPVLARFFSVWLGFFVLARFWLVFFPGFLSVSVRFGFFSFFSFLFIKPKPNRTGWFFQKFNRFNQFFFSVWFFRLFFFGFLGLIGFLVFLLTPK